MAIDLLEPTSTATRPAKSILEDAVPELTRLPQVHRDLLERAYQTLQSRSSRLVGDPAAWDSDFGNTMAGLAIRIDTRTSDELREAALRHADPVMREQALYEYADRNEVDSIELLTNAALHDTNQQVRWDALWAIEKLGGPMALDALKKFIKDSHPEIAEWSSLFREELTSGDPTFDGRPYRFISGRTFDETIFLLIHCDLYVRLDPESHIWGKLSLAPQALARVYGQALATPNVETRERQLVIAKTITGLHPDGSEHVDNYLFRGLTERTREDRASFSFECSVKRPFYISGRADDPSQGVQHTQISFQRSGRWHLDNRFQINDAAAIRYVRGRFGGWGFINLDRVAGRPLEELLTPGNAILSTLHDPVAGPRTNVFIAGTFKGKLNDWDGDGRIDVNSLNAYSTVDGEVDMDMDGVADQPGVACCMRDDGFPI